MKTLFDKTKLKNLELKNRFIRSATHEGFAEKDGSLNDKLIDIYENVAKGGVSTIITGFAFVMEGEPSSPGMIGAYDDRFIDGFKKLTDTIHKHNTNIVLQVAEGGSQAKFNLKKRTVYGPSAVEHRFTGVTPVEMTQQDIKNHVNAFGEAALRAKNSGFDAIQIHAAHGYLLSQFLSEKKADFIFRIYENMREKAGDDFPIFIKINCSDFMGDEGLSFDYSRWVCRKLDEMGINLIEISGNVGFNTAEPEIIRANINTDRTKQCYFSEYARIIADEVSAPVSVVGGNRNFELMDKILNSSNIQYFSLSRTILCEPDLVNKWLENPDYEPKCISCNKCFSLKGNQCRIL